MMDENSINYVATPTNSRFHNCNDFVRGLVGPIGSGKSVACVLEIILRAQQQEPGRDGVRRTKVAVIRNTYRELIDTTIETFRDWIPNHYRSWSAQDMKHTIRFNDGAHDIECEVLFRALDRPGDVKKLLSLELTFAWVNEAREVPKAVIDMLVGRLGRYPSMRDTGPTWYGLWMDTNPCDTDHWWYIQFEEERPEEWTIFHQPSATGPNAENIKNLPDKYYSRLSAGKKKAWKDVYVEGKYGFVQDGKPVYPDYNDEIHTAKDILEPIPGLDVHVGLDFGLTPAALFGQQTTTGQWRQIDEVVATRMGAKNFAKELGKLIRSKYAGYTIIITGDPAGDADAQTDEQTVYQILDANGINATPAYTNDAAIRIEAVTNLLTQMTITGAPAYLVSPHCKMYRKAMSGGYCFKRVQVTGDEKFKDKPDKNNPFSHVADAGQYQLLGAGEGFAVIGQDAEEFNAPMDENPYLTVI